MAKLSKHGSPTLDLAITDEQHAEAIRSNSGGCLIADAITKQYPNLSRVVVDMATIRASDAAEGVRYAYLTPPVAQHVLLAFDQGWPNPADHVVIKRAVQITPTTRSRTGRNSPVQTARRRDERIAELTAKQERGNTLTPRERASLTQMRNPKPAPERPASPGPRDVQMTKSGGGSPHPVIHGGRPLLQGAAHPNLLRGRDRHFGAKLADPGEAFREAVEATVAERLAAEPKETP